MLKAEIYIATSFHSLESVWAEHSVSLNLLVQTASAVIFHNATRHFNSINMVEW